MPTKRAAPGGNIVLIGFMGSGKSAVARRLGELTGRRCVDTDSIVEECGLSIRDIFASEGEKGFRRREQDAIVRASRSKDAVIATGGGVVLVDQNVRSLKKSGVLVYLRASADELTARLGDGVGRPLLRPPIPGTGPKDVTVTIRKLLAARAPLYETVADVVVDVDGRPVGVVADEVLRRIGVGKRTSRVRTVDVALDPAYRVTVGRGLLRRAAALLDLPRSVERACIITHPRIARLWGGALAGGLKGARAKTTTLTFSEGESKKTLESVSRLYRRLAAAGVHRSDLVLALGGGVVGDVAGFVASTYGRGLRLVQVPTTLLAMVDSAVGGKTGFNLPEGKNLVGTFYQPDAVLADLDTLKTLPDREFRGGLAEVVKYALIADPDLGERVAKERDAIVRREEPLEDVVVRSVEIKAEVVASDEKETGRRAILNYGHTLGHALEALGISGRGPALHHGEAISIGMVFAAHLSSVLGVAESDLASQHVDLLAGVGLPTAVPGVTWEDVRRFMVLDKKYVKGLRFVLLRAPGRPEIVADVPQRAIEEALRRTGERA